MLEKETKNENEIENKDIQPESGIKTESVQSDSDIKTESKDIINSEVKEIAVNKSET